MQLVGKLLVQQFVGPGCGLMAARRGARAPALLACGLLAVGWVGLALEHASLPWVAAMALVSGIGLAAVYAAAPMLIVEASPAQRTSETTGVSSVLRHLFNATGSQLMALMLASNPAAPARTAALK